MTKIPLAYSTPCVRVLGHRLPFLACVSNAGMVNPIKGWYLSVSEDFALFQLFGWFMVGWCRQHVFNVSFLMIIIVSNNASGFYGNMNYVRAFWSTCYSRTKLYLDVKMSSTVTAGTCVQHNPHVTRDGAIKFAWAELFGPVSPAILLLGHTYYSTALMALFIVCSCRKCYRCCLKMWHWRFDGPCGYNTIGRRRILVQSPNST
jgi:hypothetical protein